MFLTLYIHKLCGMFWGHFHSFDTPLIPWSPYYIPIFKVWSYQCFVQLSLLYDLLVICKNERLINPVTLFPLFIQSLMCLQNFKSRKENPQKLTQLSSRSHPRHLMGKRTEQKDTIIDISSDSQVNSNFPYRWSPASLTFNNCFYLFLYLYIT